MSTEISRQDYPWQGIFETWQRWRGAPVKLPRIRAKTSELLRDRLEKLGYELDGLPVRASSREWSWTVRLVDTNHYLLCPYTMKECLLMDDERLLSQLAMGP